MQASDKDSGVGKGRVEREAWNDALVLPVRGHTAVLVSKGALEPVLCHSLARLWHMCGVSTERESRLLQRSYSSRGRIRQCLLGTTGGYKPARSTPTSPLKQFPMAVRERDGEALAPLCGESWGQASRNPWAGLRSQAVTLVHILLEIQW